MQKECIGVIGGHSGDSIVDTLHELCYKVALVGGKKKEPGMNTADFVLVEDLSNHNRILDFLRKNEVKFVIVGTGHIKAIELARCLEEQGFILSIDYKKSLIAKNKAMFKKLLGKLDILTPSYISFYDDYNINNIIEMIGIPCVVKSSTDSIQPQKVSSREELINAIDEVKNTNTEVLIEKYIKGNDCTVAVISDGLSIKSLGVLYYSKAKEYKLKGFDEAYSYKMSEQIEERITNIAEKIVSQLGFIGLVRVDFIVDSEIYVLELNSIIVTGYNGSAYSFFKEKGIDIANEMVDNSINIYINKLNQGIVLLNN